jgi:hypothetical protein
MNSYFFSKFFGYSSYFPGGEIGERGSLSFLPIEGQFGPNCGQNDTGSVYLFTTSGLYFSS